MLTVEYIFPAVAVAGDIGSTAAGDKLSLLHILTASPGHHAEDAAAEPAAARHPHRGRTLLGLAPHVLQVSGGWG